MTVTGDARAADESTPRPGFSVIGENPDAPDANFLGVGADTTNQIAGWAPGTQPYVLPPGTGQNEALAFASRPCP